jgi:azurin
MVTWALSVASAFRRNPVQARRRPDLQVRQTHLLVFMMLLLALSAGVVSAAAQESAPRILYDTSPRAVEYQLARLSNDQLLRVERTDSDAKYRPVHVAILIRRAIPRSVRADALAALVKIDGTSPTRVLLEALAKVPATDGTESDGQNVDALLAMLMGQPAGTLRQHRSLIATATTSSVALVRRGAYGALMIADGDPMPAWQAAKRDGHLQDLLGSVAQLGNAEALRAKLFTPMMTLIGETKDADTRAAAIGALPWTRRDSATFDLLAREILQNTDVASRAAAMTSIKLIPESAWMPGTIEPLARAIVAVVRDTPAARRTSPSTLDAIQLGEKLSAALPAEARLAVRRDLRALGVQVVRVQTIPEQMQFDLNWFVVQAGKPVQIQLTNLDAMPHNLVIGQPGSLQEIGTQGGVMPPPADPEARAYVPDTPLVLQATRLVNAGDVARLNFTAPAKPGQYIYVCTFPGHWVRMYGVMLVVDDVDAWERKPDAPADPTTNKPFASQRNGGGA